MGYRKFYQRKIRIWSTNGSNPGTFTGKTNRGSIGEVVVLPPTIAFIVSEGPE